MDQPVQEDHLAGRHGPHGADPPPRPAAGEGTALPQLDVSALALLARLVHPVWVFDVDHSRVHWANAAALALWHADDLRELNARDMASDMSEPVARRLRQYQRECERDDARSCELWTLYPRGVPRTLSLVYSGVRLPGGRVALLCEAVDEPWSDAGPHASQPALHDPLTDLPNRHFMRKGFRGRLGELLASGQQAALVCIDLDHFKKINDLLGHAAGDRLLVETARRLRHAVREQDLVVRLGGDEFLVFAAVADGGAAIEALGERLLQAIARPVRLAQHEVRVTASLGACCFPRDGRDVDTLMRQADLAMYSAKEGGRGRVACFTSAMQTRAHTRLRLEIELRRAVERREFVVHYQPRYSLRSDRMVGVEALVRWQHPQRGLVLPETFIPVCEEAGLIQALGEQVLEQVTAQLRRWQDAGAALSVAVNLSSRQFAHAGLLYTLARIIEGSGCDPARLEMEITESLLLGNDEATLQALHGLRRLGCGVAVDDFGTGYSNLAYLQRLPLTCLKIDRSFIGHMPQARALSDMIVSLGHALGLRVVAEGVETEEQLQWLRQTTCDEFQGFLRSPPVPAGAIDALLRQGPLPR
ncbi:putative bifunctional diguanylate cyclase/phosphodiesterase [Melaminivora sp.]|uniref:putative bifunctional diguanylate cyclase/phosphodiesterase n=1 Tax=Melaminivora sp. TaxID=1933032 RepID=UPI0028AF2CE2|nr:EAL domain-containing protein [Melaminivora sp.]